jgi:hypothetical protein
MAIDRNHNPDDRSYLTRGDGAQILLQLHHLAEKVESAHDDVKGMRTDVTRSTIALADHEGRIKSIEGKVALVVKHGPKAAISLLGLLGLGKAGGYV